MAQMNISPLLITAHQHRLPALPHHINELLTQRRILIQIDETAAPRPRLTLVQAKQRPLQLHNLLLLEPLGLAQPLLPLLVHVPHGHLEPPVVLDERGRQHRLQDQVQLALLAELVHVFLLEVAVEAGQVLDGGRLGRVAQGAKGLVEKGARRVDGGQHGCLGIAAQAFLSTRSGHLLMGKHKILILHTKLINTTKNFSVR